jgi:hypothetical protein
MSCTRGSGLIPPPERAQGWTISFIERDSRYWLVANAGFKNAQLFQQGTQSAWQWAKNCVSVRWFTDGEQRYSQQLWLLASQYLKSFERPKAYGYRKVWREGLSVAMKIKGSQGRKRVKWVNPEHPYTAPRPKTKVGANYNEALNSSIRRRCSAYRRRTNTYAKKVEGLQRALDVLRLVHNWVRPHNRLGKGITPAMALGLYHRPIQMEELLSWRCHPNSTTE